METFYPDADRSSQWFAGTYPGDRMTPRCGCLHTTEGTGWPDYGGGRDAPHITAMPDWGAQRLRFRQHFPFDRSARALVNSPGGVETNTSGVVQIELVGTCDPRTHQAWADRGIRHIYWPEAPDWALRDLAQFMAWHRDRNGIPLTGPATWKAYPGSYGGGNGVRISFGAWPSFRGWCGHQHVPENDHGDPGNIDFQRLVAMAGGSTPPAGGGGGGGGNRVRVWAGATLSLIAVLAGVSLGSLLKANPQITNPNQIQPGQSITLPEGANPVTPPGGGGTGSTPTDPPGGSTPSGALAPGSRGAEVTALQQQLNRLGNHLVVDGVYGPETAAAVNSVIRATPGLGAADGVAGPRTRQTIADLAARTGSTRPTGALAPGSRGAEVSTLQRQLTAIGYPVAQDGVYGPKTTAAVNAFIRLNPSLGAADGVAGPLTRQRIASAAAAVTSHPVSLRPGDRNADVKVLQQQLNRLGYPMPTTGYYGPMTTNAVNSVIRRHTGLGKADGVAGPLTRKKIAALAAAR